MLCSNLQRTLDVMKKAGLATPKSFILRSEKDIEQAANKIGFPAVIKPISGAGSMGVIKVQNLDDLKR